MVRKIRQGPVIQMDETRVQVMKEPGLIEYEKLLHAAGPGRAAGYAFSLLSL